MFKEEAKATLQTVAATRQGSCH